MKDLSLSINLNDYDVTTTEFTNWVVEGKMDVYAIAAHGGNGSKLYFFQNIEDFTAFTLKFTKRSATPSINFYTNGSCQLTI